MLDACCNATSSFAIPHLGGTRLNSSHRSGSISVDNSQRSGCLGEAESVWLETVGRGVLLGNTRIWKDVKVHTGT